MAPVALGVRALVGATGEVHEDGGGGGGGGKGERGGKDLGPAADAEIDADGVTEFDAAPIRSRRKRVEDREVGMRRSYSLRVLIKSMVSALSSRILFGGGVGGNTRVKNATHGLIE